MNLLEVIAKNCGLAVVDSVTLGLGSAVKNSFYEIKDHVSQCNDALYLMQIKTFIETIDLDEGEVKDFFSKNPDNNRLGIELFKILSDLYLQRISEDLNKINIYLKEKNCDSAIPVLKQLEADYEGIVIPRPKHWGGFLVTPIEVEFWQGRPNRLHDRIRFIAQEDYSWKIDRLSP